MATLRDLSRVRKLNAATGIIETIAGQFPTSFSGDGGPATQALFWEPMASAVDRVGNLYIADSENSRIRKVAASTGIVNTIAGSGSCSMSPIHVLVCQGGFGGDGGPAIAAQLNYPYSAALDAAGNLYISDTSNHRIRRVDAATSMIYTIAGTGVRGFSGDSGPALLAEIDLPSGIAVDSSGRVYFADNYRVRMLTPTEPGRTAGMVAANSQTVTAPAPQRHYTTHAPQVQKSAFPEDAVIESIMRQPAAFYRVVGTTQLIRMGDLAAQAEIRVFGSKAMDDEQIGLALDILHKSFERVYAVNPAFRAPNATLFLLAHFALVSSSEETKQKVETTRQFVVNAKPDVTR